MVTGASDGIGRELARQLAGAGLNLVLVARRAEPLERLANELRRTCGVEARSLPVDLSRPEAPAAVAESTAELPVGLLVAAAGFGTSGSFVDTGLDEELELIDVNCRAVAALAHRFGARFARQGRGGLVFLISVLLESALKLLPRWGRVRMMGLIMDGMTRHQACDLATTIATAARSPGSRPAE